MKSEKWKMNVGARREYRQGQPQVNRAKKMQTKEPGRNNFLGALLFFIFLF
jgi:hypothetical protein